MDRLDLLREAQSLPVSERIALAQELLNSVQKELAQRDQRKLDREERDRRWAAAAAEAVQDYLPGGDLYLPDTMDFYNYDDE
jgi:hypothetical protein